jgi:hypothetical protein
MRQHFLPHPAYTGISGTVSCYLQSSKLEPLTPTNILHKQNYRIAAAIALSV